MGTFIDLTGQKFGKLTAIKRIRQKKYKNGSHSYWLCRCECGNLTEVEVTHLKNGNTKSCGCLKKNRTMQNSTKKHYTGESSTRLYRVWIGMKTRCYNPKAGNYKYYGAKGVSICEEWIGDDGYRNFKSWALKNGYKNELTIDRKDNNKSYSPDNCRWVTQKEQARNTSQVKMLEYKGEVRSIPEWAENVGISTECLKQRIKNGWSIEKCIETPSKRTLKTEYRKGI